MKRGLLLAGAVALAGAAAGAWVLLERRADDARPDIVLVVWDTCRADRVSTFGYDRPTAPHLDAFASRGIRYASCYAPAPWTAPSHGSMFTGLLPHRHGLMMGMADRIRADVPLLAETLSREGYETVGITANFYISDLTGLSRGFADFSPAYVPGKDKTDARRVQEVFDAWLARRRAAGGRRRPCFLFVNLMDPHTPLSPPAEDVAAVRREGVEDASLEAALRVGHWETMAHLLGIRRVDDATLQAYGALYDASIRHMDTVTAEMLSSLEREGLLSKAMVVVASDHGENLGEHGQMDHRMSLYDQTLHVPLVVRWPGHYEGGGTVRGEVGLADLYPTMLAAAGVAAPRGTGLDAVPLPAADTPGRVLVAEFGCMESNIRTVQPGFPGAADAYFDPLRLSIESARDPASAPAPRKYIRFLKGPAAPGAPVVREELYDVRADPGETRNLLAPGAAPAEVAAGHRLAGEIERNFPRR